MGKIIYLGEVVDGVAQIRIPLECGVDDEQAEMVQEGDAE